MNLTICLVTKGREDYIDDVLSSFLPLIEYENVEVFIVDNGSDAICQKKIADWQSTNSSKSRLFRFESNDPSYAVIWPEILKANVDWIVMPGDDDFLRSEILNEWKTATTANPNLVAFAAGAQVMNENGVLIDVILQPTAAMAASKMEQVATAFHGPAFIWPTLFFRAGSIDLQVPPSRYAFDWWVGLNLLVAGDVLTTTSIGIDYRVHSIQETNLAPLRRKFFEGSFWLGEYVRSDGFKIWITSLNDEDRLLLWDALLRKMPIYGDAHFGNPLMHALAHLLMSSSQNIGTSYRISTEFAALYGVFLRDGEVSSLLLNRDESFTESRGNIRIIPAIDTCFHIVKASQLVTGLENAREFGVYCKHSNKKKGHIFVECDRNILNTPTVNADLLINAITSFCENQKEFDIALSSSEKRVLSFIKSVQNGSLFWLMPTMRIIKKLPGFKSY